MILLGVRKNRRRVLIGRDAHFLDLFVRLLPSAYQALVVWISRRMAPRPGKAPAVYETQDERGL